MKTKLKKLFGVILKVLGIVLNKIGTSFVSVGLGATKHSKKFLKK